jgi:hypothetical protein
MRVESRPEAYARKWARPVEVRYRRGMGIKQTKLPGDERRAHRSQVPGEALHFFLDALANSHGLSALALADGEGKLVAGARAKHAAPLTDIAAVGRAVALGEDAGGFDKVTAGEDLYALRIVLGGHGGRELFLTSLGARVKSVRKATIAIERILSGS